MPSYVRGKLVDKYIVVTCPKCKESTMYNWKDVVPNSFSGYSTAALRCEVCGHEYTYSLILPVGVDHLYYVKPYGGPRG